MAYILGDTKNHRVGAYWEDHIFDYLKQELKLPLFRVESSLNEINSRELREYLKEYIHCYDFINLKTGELYEVKSKHLRYNKDDRKFDISENQYNAYIIGNQLGFKIKIIFIWYTDNGKYYFKTNEFRKLKVIGKIKKKFYLAKEIKYSPKYVEYKSLSKKELIIFQRAVKYNSQLQN